VIDGLPIRLIDSAGVRNSSCPIEKLGVEASLEQMKSADAILLLWGEDWKQFPKELLQLDFSKTIFIHSKSDLRTQRRADCYNQDLGVEMLDVSSVTQSGISTLQDRLVQLLSKRYFGFIPLGSF
jgi:tRNA modification GTPase